jgi:Fe2+ transport system protein FeoA
MTTPAFTCLLCGARFSHGDRTCGSCPLARACDLVSCPRCGYSFPRTSRLVEAFRALGRWLKKRDPAPPSHVASLDRFPAGVEGEVVYVARQEPQQRVRLSNLGLVPGASVVLQQSCPAAVVQVGETTLALDPEIAAAIYVKRAGGDD